MLKRKVPSTNTNEKKRDRKKLRKTREEKKEKEKKELVKVEVKVDDDSITSALKNKNYKMLVKIITFLLSSKDASKSNSREKRGQYSVELLIEIGTIIYPEKKLLFLNLPSRLLHRKFETIQKIIGKVAKSIEKNSIHSMVSLLQKIRNQEFKKFITLAKFCLKSFLKMYTATSQEKFQLKLQKVFLLCQSSFLILEEKIRNYQNECSNVETEVVEQIEKCIDFEYISSCFTQLATLAALAKNKNDNNKE